MEFKARGQNPEHRRAGNIIKLTENREVLIGKLKEYQSRLKPNIAPEEQISTLYKIAVTQALVEKGEVTKETLVKELETKYGFLDAAAFGNAWGVIADYTETGGANVRGGTGLRKEEE